MAALFDLILCAFLVFDETEAKEDSSRWFTSYLYFVTIANGVEILAVIFSSQGFHVSPAIKMAITSISFFMNNLAFWQFFNYIEASAKERSTFVNRIIGVNRILLAAEVFLLLTNLFLHNAFYFSDKMEYNRGPYFAAVTFLLPLYFIVVALVLVKRNNQRMGRRKVASILVASVLNIVGLVLQIYFHGTLLMALPFASLGIFVLYFAVESPDFDSSAVNEKSGAYGLFQWTDDGDRKQALKEYCIEHDLSRDSIDAQLAFAIYEIGGADPIACRLDRLLRETDDAYAAAAEFAVGFERCITDDAGRADTYTGSLYPEFYGKRYQHLSKRINKALNYYNRLASDSMSDRLDQ